MRIVLEQGDGHRLRHELAALFNRCKDKGSDRYRQVFDWYYRDNGGRTVRTWLLRACGRGELVGACSVVPRTFLWSRQRLNIGVVGNFLVADEARRSFGALSLIRASLSMLSNGEVDILLGIPNANSAPVALRMGFRVLGKFARYVQVRRSRTRLHERLGWKGSCLSPVVNLWALSGRRFSAASSAPHFDVIDLTRSAVLELPTADWTLPDQQFVQEASGEFLCWRFLDIPGESYRILGIMGAWCNAPCGCVVVKLEPGRVSVSHCQTDVRCLQPADAILNVWRHWHRDGDTFHVRPLGSSRLARDLPRLGFNRLPNFVQTGGRHVVGAWRPDHPLANQLAEAKNWNLLPGFIDI